VAGRTIGYAVGGIVIAVAGLIIGVGSLYICAASAPGPGGRLTSGIILLMVGLVVMAIGVAIVWVVRTRGPRPIQQIVQQLELDMPGDAGLEKLKCQNCGAELDKDSVTLAEGAVVISCPYCGSTYQITEEPKW